MRTSMVARSAPAMRGHLRHRLLLNAVVDPDEAARRLPDGVRPHVTDLGTIVGCCLLDIERLRPARLPAAAGVSMRAAAHRISAEWADRSGRRIVGVYVPGRVTSSPLATLAGGRVFPGVHRRADVAVRRDAAELAWSVSSGSGDDPWRLRVRALVGHDAPVGAASGPVGGTCLTAAVGLSPGRDGRPEGARMEPDSLGAHQVEVDEIDSAFLSSFASARMAPAFLMEDVGVRWTPAPAPTSALVTL